MHEQATNEVQQSWLSAHTHTLLSKLKVIEQQLLVLTYSSDTMPALRKVDDHLTRAQRKLDARDKQVSSTSQGSANYWILAFEPSCCIGHAMLAASTVECCPLLRWFISPCCSSCVHGLHSCMSAFSCIE